MDVSGGIMKNYVPAASWLALYLETNIYIDDILVYYLDSFKNSFFFLCSSPLLSWHKLKLVFILYAWSLEEIFCYF